MQEGYHGGSRPKRITRRQIQEMIQNMKKVKIVNEKSKKYHENEKDEADNILKKLNEK